MASSEYRRNRDAKTQKKNGKSAKSLLHIKFCVAPLYSELNRNEIIEDLRQNPGVTVSNGEYLYWWDDEQKQLFAQNIVSGNKYFVPTKKS